MDVKSQAVFGSALPRQSGRRDFRVLGDAAPKRSGILKDSRITHALFLLPELCFTAKPEYRLIRSVQTANFSAQFPSR